jgi:hypothetical protein
MAIVRSQLLLKKRIQLHFARNACQSRFKIIEFGPNWNTPERI